MLGAQDLKWINIMCSASMHLIPALWSPQRLGRKGSLAVLGRRGDAFEFSFELMFKVPLGIHVGG